ncbi:hypothetical protein QTV44_002534 [Vibrio vulnificus]|nr:hypothetical protein [Vibrio vulnificus]
MSGNAELANLIRLMSRQANAAVTKEEVHSVAAMAKAYDGEFRYDNKPMYWLSVTGVMTFALLYYWFNQRYYSLGVNQYIYLSLCVLIAVVPLLLVFSRRNAISSLSTTLFRKDCLLDNQIEKIEAKGALCNRLLKGFIEFDRGNYSNSIAELYRTTSLSDRQYHFYRYHYIDREVRTRIVSDGKGGTKTVTETVYHHYDRYGLVFEINLARGLAVISSGHVPRAVRYRPASIAFTKMFSIGALTEHDAAKLVPPTLQLALLEVGNRFKGFNIDINADGLLCMSFNEDVLAASPKTDLTEPEKYFDELTGTTKLPLLKELLAFYDTLVDEWTDKF